MNITNAQAARINKMNRAAKDVDLGTFLQKSTGSFVVTATESNGSRIVVATGLDAVTGVMGQLRRSGSPINLNVVSGSVAGTIVAMKDTTVTGSAISVGDVFTYIAF